MGSPTGRGEYIPKAIFRGVIEHARRLGYAVATDDLFLLAVAELPRGTPAREVLGALGVSADRLRNESFPTSREPAEREGLLFPPAYNALAGRAEAFAASLGSGPISPEHVLIALIWDPTSLSSQLLWRLGLSREDIIEGLRSRGVAVPRAKLPPQREIDIGKRVWLDRDQLQRVISEVPKKLPLEAHFGFNYEGERAWVVAEASVDLRSLVEEALAS
jgi:hypothetical protein